MKSLIIVCVMGLISIFDCKVGGEKIVEVFGPELVDQVRWCEVGLSWYDYNGNAYWVGNGLKLSCSGNQAGAIGKDGFLVKGKVYRVVVDVTYVSGWVEMSGGCTIHDGGRYSGGGYDFQVNYGGHFEFDMINCGVFGVWRIDSSMFVGSIDKLSIRELTYIEEDE